MLFRLRNMLIPILLVQMCVLFVSERGYSGSLGMNVGSISFKKNVKTMKEMKFKNVVKQTKDYSCGAAAMSTIMTYYFGRETNEAEVLDYILRSSDKEKKSKIEKKGLSLLDLKEYAEHLGYEGGGYRVSVDILSSLARPAIALINVKDYAHFVVLKGAAKGKVYIADPARGNMSYPMNEFTDIWNGIILVFSDPAAETIRTSPLNAKMTVQGAHKYKLMETLAPMRFTIGPSEF